MKAKSRLFFFVQDMLEGSQGQFIALEKKMQGEVTAVEKKYHKAKKIIKEYQQRLVSISSSSCEQQKFRPAC